MKRKAQTRDSFTSEHAAIYDELGSSHQSPSQDVEQWTNQTEPNWIPAEATSPINNFDGGFDDVDRADSPSEGKGDTYDPEQAHFRKSLGLKRIPEHLNLSSPNGSQATNGHIVERRNIDESNYIVTQDANGGPRFLYGNIDPIYDSDDSDAPEIANTIGNIPLSFYNLYPHIGYDIDGKRVMRPAKGAALDSLLDSIEIPQGWTGLIDPETGKPLELNKEELDILKRLTRNEVPIDGYDLYPDMLETFTNKTETMPLSAAPEPKRRFVPSKHESKRIMKIVKAIREGRIQPYSVSSELQEEDTDLKIYDIWADEARRSEHPMNVPAPKLAPPGYDESYRPPPEYLPDDEEKRVWYDLDEEERPKGYLPFSREALRKVPGYEKFVKEKFDRCLDLYLAPRVRRNKLDMDPQSLLPKLPSPEELKPFPRRCDVAYIGHSGRVRSLAISPRGDYLASAGDDGTIRIWDLLSGRQLWIVTLDEQESVNVVRWRPGKDALILSAAVGEHIYLIAPFLPFVSSFENSSGAKEQAELHIHDIINSGWTAQRARLSSEGNGKQQIPAKWSRPETHLQEKGAFVKISVRAGIKWISWHGKGDYFSTVSPDGHSTAIAIHMLSKHLTQFPFRRLKGLPQGVRFHPSKPLFFVATQKYIRSYDLIKQTLVRTLQPGAKWISSFDVHISGDHLIVGSYDRRLLWFDLDLSSHPYKTLRYHQKAIRAVRYHQGGYPLFADASDDGTIQVFHGKVVGDLMENATIVPLKVLRGHSIKQGLGILDIDWHPTSPWCVSAGADGTCRLWMD